MVCDPTVFPKGAFVRKKWFSAGNPPRLGKRACLPDRCLALVLKPVIQTAG